MKDRQSIFITFWHKIKQILASYYFTANSNKKVNPFLIIPIYIQNPALVIPTRGSPKYHEENAIS